MAFDPEAEKDTHQQQTPSAGVANESIHGAEQTGRPVDDNDGQNDDNDALEIKNGNASRESKLGMTVDDADKCELPTGKPEGDQESYEKFGSALNANGQIRPSTDEGEEITKSERAEKTMEGEDDTKEQVGLKSDQGSGKDGEEITTSERAEKTVEGEDDTREQVGLTSYPSSGKVTTKHASLGEVAANLSIVNLGGSRESKHEVPPVDATDKKSSREHVPCSSYASAGPTARTSLDEETLSALRVYLKSKSYAKAELDEEKVMDSTLAIHRDATERARYRKDLVENFQALGGRDDSYDRIFKEEEYFSLASESFKRLVDKASAKAEGVDMDLRTLAWVKRAAGLQKSDDPLEKFNDYMSDSEEGETETSSSRRMTRGVRKERRKERMRKETEGLSIFLEAVREIEEERRTSFDEASHQSSGMYAPMSDSEVSDETSPEREIVSRQSGYRQTSRDYPPESELIATLGGGKSSTVRLLFRGKVISSASFEVLEEWYRPRKRKRRQIRRRSKKRARDAGMAQLANGGSQSGFSVKGSAQAVGTEEGKVHREYYLPDLDQSLKASKLTAVPERVKVGQPIKHASLITKLYRFLGGRARNWARHEFFYPELDAAWHEFDPRAAKIASWVPHGMQLSWDEWKCIRRQFGRPRRFSRAFISKEVGRRNRFRQVVRNFQHNSSLSNVYSFHVPSILQPGTIINALNKRYQIIQQGTVLFYSKGDNGYFVQFHNEQLGCEFCPDTEVERAFPPRLLLPDKDGSTAMNGKQMKRSPRREAVDELKGGQSEFDLAYERRSLVCLVRNVERAIARKKAILDAIEEQNHFASPYRRFENHNFESNAFYADEGMQQTVGAWLHANLILTNGSLSKASEYLTSAYADASPGEPSTRRSPETSPGKMEEEVMLEEELLTKMAKKLVRSLGSKETNPTLMECTKDLIKLELRRALEVPTTHSRSGPRKSL